MSKSVKKYYITYVGIPTELPNFMELAAGVEQYVKEHTPGLYRIAGSGTGLGYRDLEFGPYGAKREAERLRLAAQVFLRSKRLIVSRASKGLDDIFNPRRRGALNPYVTIVDYDEE